MNARKLWLAWLLCTAAVIGAWLFVPTSLSQAREVVLVLLTIAVEVFGVLVGGDALAHWVTRRQPKPQDGDGDGGAA